jgi:hypothetical protein
MKMSINRFDFSHAFREYDRDDNFTLDALNTLFDYYEELEEDCGIEMELDVIAICCEWNEWTAAEIIREFAHLVTNEDVTLLSILEALDREVTVIEVEHGINPRTYLVQVF